MEILHSIRHRDSADQLLVSFTQGCESVTAAEIICCLEENNYHRSLSWL